MIDILFVAFNRAEFTRESFAALAANTDWDMVDTLYVRDDGSTDGTTDLLREASDALRDSVTVVYERRNPRDEPDRHVVARGPVAAMNWYLDSAAAAGREHGDMFAKIDNDFVVCPGWLNVLERVMFLHPELDLLGTEPMTHVTGPVAYSPWEPNRGYQEARHIGGKGLIRLRAFEHCRPRPGGFNGYQGFTQWQQKHPGVSKGWVEPELPVFGLDQLPFEPWQTLTERYEELRWARRWGPYSDDAVGYWDWWTPTATPDVAA